MELKDIIASSMRNTLLFATMEKKNNHLVFKDEHQKDKYYHNFINLLGNLNYTKQQIIDYYQEAIRNSDDFLIFRIEEPVIHLEDFSFMGNLHMDENLYYASKIGALKIKDTKIGTVKKVTQADQEALQTMIYEGSKEFGVDYALGNAKRRIEILFSHQNIYHCYFVYAEEEIAGYIFTIQDQSNVELDDFWIKEKYQKHGYGSSLLHYVIQDLSTQGIEEVFLMAAKEDTAQYMYEKMNFKLIGESKMIRKMLKETK